LVVGDGETRGDLTQYSKKNGLLEKTMFTGYVDDVRPYIQSMDVACLTPKENEGLSNVILEEMAMGKPVIATDVGGNAELVVDGVTGFIIEPGDKHALARRIMSLHQNHALRESMGFEGRKRVEEHFTIQTMIKNMEAFYFDLLRSTIGAME
jgi:glycosyltransferase involved in cell wall biosynthesis